MTFIPLLSQRAGIINFGERMVEQDRINLQVQVDLENCTKVEHIPTESVSDITDDVIWFEDYFYIPTGVTEFHFWEGMTLHTWTWDGVEWQESISTTAAYSPNPGPITEISDGVTHDGNYFIIPDGVTSFTFKDNDVDMEATYDDGWSFDVVEEEPADPLKAPYQAAGDVDLYESYKTTNGTTNNLTTSDTSDECQFLGLSASESDDHVGKPLVIMHPTEGITRYTILSHNTGSNIWVTVDRNFEEGASSQRAAVFNLLIKYDDVAEEFELSHEMDVFTFIDHGNAKIARKENGTWSFQDIHNKVYDEFEEYDEGNLDDISGWSVVAGEHNVGSFSNLRSIQSASTSAGRSLNEMENQSVNQFSQVLSHLISTNAGRYGGCGVRSNAANNGYNIVVRGGATGEDERGEIRLRKGTTSIIEPETFNIKAEPNDYVAVFVETDGDNAKLTCYLNGVKIGEYTDTQDVITEGVPSIQTISLELSGPRMDRFMAGSLDDNFQTT